MPNRSVTSDEVTLSFIKQVQSSKNRRASSSPNRNATGYAGETSAQKRPGPQMPIDQSSQLKKKILARGTALGEHCIGIFTPRKSPQGNLSEKKLENAAHSQIDLDRHSKTSESFLNWAQKTLRI